MECYLLRIGEVPGSNLAISIVEKVGREETRNITLSLTLSQYTLVDFHYCNQNDVTFQRLSSMKEPLNPTSYYQLFMLLVSPNIENLSDQEYFLLGCTCLIFLSLSCLDVCLYVLFSLSIFDLRLPSLVVNSFLHDSVFM